MFVVDTIIHLKLIKLNKNSQEIGQTSPVA